MTRSCCCTAGLAASTSSVATQLNPSERRRTTRNKAGPGPVDVSVKIEIWSDVVCPWCYIGKRRLEHALTEFEHADEVEITWRSYQLNPDMPAGQAVPTVDYMARRFGPESKVMVDRVAGLAATEGLAFDYGSSLAVNTLDAHRLLHLATELGVGGAAKERLLRAHFTEGADLSDPDTLASLLSEVGVPAERTRTVLASTEYEEEVRADIEEARMLGCSGVPFFVIDRKYGIPGAQPVEVFLGALQKAYADQD
jgi:predicted DsbA family dithiol-disulfide isomerase